MKSIEIQTKLNILDKKISSLPLHYQNTHAWPHLRTKLGLLLLQKQTGVSYKKSKFQWPILLIFVLSLFNYLANIIFKTKRDKIYFNSSSGIYKDGYEYIDTYSSESYSNRNTLFIINISKFLPVKTYIKLFTFSNVISDNAFFKLFSIPVKFFLRHRINKNQFDITIETIKNITDIINEEFPSLVSEKMILSDIIEFFSQLVTYKKMLSPLLFNQGVVISSYTKRPLVAALNTLGVSVSEIQHGIGGEFHVGYNMLYSESIPHYYLHKIDCLYVYDTMWKKSFRNCDLFKKSEINIIGNKKLELASKGKLPKAIRGKKFILITGQAQFFNELSTLIIDFISLQKNNNYKVLYRPHPKENLELSTLVPACDEFIYFDDKKYLTELLIRECCMHVSVYSACHFDAIYFKGKTYCYDVMSDSPIKEYIKSNNNFITFRWASELIELLDK